MLTSSSINFSHPTSRFWQDNKLKERRSSPSHIVTFLLYKWVVIIMHLWVDWHIWSLSLTYSSLGGNWRTWTWKSSSQSAGMVSFVYILRWTVIILLIFYVSSWFVLESYILYEMLEAGDMDVVMTYHDLLIAMCSENYHELEFVAGPLEV